ncbi:hypothetical protein LCGC14_2893340, partial [marine sediment metagenome]
YAQSDIVNHTATIGLRFQEDNTTTLPTGIDAAALGSTSRDVTDIIPLALMSVRSMLASGSPFTIDMDAADDRQTTNPLDNRCLVVFSDEAALAGTPVSDSQPAYMPVSSGTATSDNQAAYLVGIAGASDSQSAYLSGAPVGSTFSQEYFRIRSGDTVGLNTDSGWAAAENTSTTIGTGLPFRIRFKVREAERDIPPPGMFP